MKVGIIGVETVILGCPECIDGYAVDPFQGSAFFTEADWRELPATVTCIECGKEFRKPRRNPFAQGRTNHADG